FTVGVDSAVANLLIAGASYERTRSDSKIFPLRGLRLRGNIQGSQKGVIGTASFFQAKAGAKLVYGFAPQFRVLARAEIGQTLTKNFHALPPTLRYFTGGGQSVRGFDYLTLGPVDSTGHVIGGPSLVVGSVEVDYHLLPRWLVAAFTDMGNATERLSLSGLQQSVGVGIRFLAPIGLIRVDAAFAIGGPTTPFRKAGNPFRLHFSIGPDL
ncbi:MAG: BamA/TamA family outer membrane protein, partial [Gemmatimonadota bacterium]